MSNDPARILLCPKCRRPGAVAFKSDSAGIVEATCAACGYALPLHHGLADFAEHIPLDDPKASRAQRVMNTRLFAFIYESPLWRPLHTKLGSGVSMKQESDQILKWAEGSTVEAVADLACGTGHYARAFAERFPSATVFGLDISAAMLDQGQKIAQKEGLNGIFFLRGDLYRLPFADASMDRVNCGGALHLFPNLSTIWKEIHRVLKPGGIFTAMTITMGHGTVERIQQRIMQKGQGTFFERQSLERELGSVGLGSFDSVQKRFTLLFRVVKSG